jgi:predicted negative regulator of RcsB-dependent stress response
VDDLLSEKEQIEKMRAWWSDYGWYVIGGIALGAFILFGINYYQSKQAEDAVAASVLYDEISEHVTNGNLEAAEAAAGRLGGEYGNSSYAAQSKLAMARLYMDKNRDQDAAGALNELLAMGGFEHLKHVARVRLAKILLYQGKPEEVLSLLEGEDNQAFAATYAEERGDAYVALGRYDEARAAYQAALSGGQQTVDQGLIQLKLLDLPVDAGQAPEAAEDEAAAAPAGDSSE